MLSIENPPESSSSHKKAQPSLTSVDEKCSSDNNLHDSQKHSFSIRDYVFSSRSKDIKSSWPFPEQSLQLCLKHGIKEILPPFEPPDLIRSQIFIREVEQISPQAAGPSDKNPVHLNDDPSLSRLRDKAKPSEDLDCSDAELRNLETEIHSTLTSNDQSDKQLSQISEPPVLLEKPGKKKCRLIVKLSTITEINRVEDISSASTVSDIMASKICPVCKTFSSSSNTTLNAHIDQCLSEESNAERINVGNEPKLKVKPKKKRLMVDIYTTAPVCTLEDLDRRNGTNWAVELAVLATSMAPGSVSVPQTTKVSLEKEEVGNESKKARFSPEDENDIQDDGDERAVYVDANGTKLRILSKFDDLSPVVSKKDFKQKKHAKNMKTGESSLLRKKKLFYAQHMKLKHIKMKQQRKKSTMPKQSQVQMQELLYSELQPDEDSEKEDSEAGFADSETPKWICSKRSDLPKKYKNKDIQAIPENNLAKSRSPLVENNLADSPDVPVLRSHILKLPRSPGNLICSDKTKKMDALCSSKINVVNKDSSKGRSESSSSANGLLLKLSRSAGKVISFPRSKREEIRRKITRWPSKFSTPSEENRSITDIKNIFAGGPFLSRKTNERDEKEMQVTNANIRKHRPKKGAGKLSILDVSRIISRFRPCKSIETEVTKVVENEEAIEEDVSTHESNDNQISEKIQLYQSEEQTENSPDEQDYGTIPGDEFHAETVSAEASITSSRSHGDTEMPHENSSVTSTGPVESQDPNIATNTFTSGSPVSTPNDPEPSKGPLRGPEAMSSNVSTGMYLQSTCTRDAEQTIMEVSSSKHAMAAITPKGPHQIMNEHPCCCSRREALHRDSQFLQPNTATLPFITPHYSNVFSSSTRTDMTACHSTSTKVTSDASFKYPSFIDFTSPSPSPRTRTLLRLMGKNLMVDEEQSVQLPSPIFDSPVNTRYTSPPRFTSRVGTWPEENFLYHQYHQFPGQVKSVHEHQVLARSLSESLFAESITQPRETTNLKFTQACGHLEIPISRSSSMTQDVVVIDDSPERETSAPMNYHSSNIGLQRSFSCFPLPNRYLTMDTSCSNFAPNFSISCPRTNTTPTKGGTAAEAPAPIPPKPYPSSSSTAQARPHVYYPQAFW